jgi:hypothetical protein
MPNDTPPLEIADTDNDDIVDLLEIVKPGSSVPSGSATPEKADDFSADLEAILGQAADAEKNPDAFPPAPFPDPTPVDHAVDPDETLNMPSMDDLNNLLASLGADSTPASSAPAPPPGKGAPLSDLDAHPMAGQRPPLGPAPQDAPNVPLDLDFESPPPRAASPAPPADERQQPPAAVPPAEKTPPEILLQEPENPQGGEVAQPPALPAIEALFAENTPQPRSLPDMETLFSGQIQDNSAPGRSPAGTDAPPDAEGLPAPEEPSDPPRETGEPSVDHGVPAAPRYDGVDLNELDAVLEDMLASAPPSSPHLTRESRGKNPSSPAEDRSGPSPELAPLQQAVSRMETGLADLKKELQARDSLIEKQQSGLAEQTALIEELRHSLTSLRENRDSLIEKQQSGLAEQTALIEELRRSLTSLHENMDKMAASSAAKVIREELASILKDDPPAS